MVDISVVIVSYNTKELLRSCLASIIEHTKGLGYEVIVVDNGSTDGSDALALIKNKTNLGFARANNQGMKKAKGRYILLLNSDTKLTEDSLTKMVMWMDKHSLTSYKHKDVGIATCKLVNADGSIQPTGGFFPTLPRIFAWMLFLDDLPILGNFIKSVHPHSPLYLEEHEQDWVTGAFFLVCREVVEEVGFLDEDFFMYVEELEYCLRAKKKGFKIWYVPETAIIHYGRASSVTSEYSIVGEFAGMRLLYKKHYPQWQWPFLVASLKAGALLRIFLFGILLGNSEARRAYAKAF